MQAYIPKTNNSEAPAFYTKIEDSEQLISSLKKNNVTDIIFTDDKFGISLVVMNWMLELVKERGSSSYTSFILIQNDNGKLDVLNNITEEIEKYKKIPRVYKSVIQKKNNDLANCDHFITKKEEEIKNLKKMINDAQNQISFMYKVQKPNEQKELDNYLSRSETVTDDYWNT